MIKTPFYELSNFSRLVRQLDPLVADMMELPREKRTRTVSRELLGKFNILVDDDFEWCIWKEDKDYTMFILRWS